MPAPIIDVIIPAFTSRRPWARKSDIPKGLVRHIVVVNNASSDKTSEMARCGRHRWTVERGYGNACLKGTQVATQRAAAGHRGFHRRGQQRPPEQMTEVVTPIVEGHADFAIGSRWAIRCGHRCPQRIFGNWLATRMLAFYGVNNRSRPFSAVRWEALQAMGMRDRTFGWTVEMQLKAAKQRLRITEVPVDYRKRIGFSKISGTVKGSVLAGWKIITTIIKYR